MSKKNIFQGNKLLNETVCRVLGYEVTDENITHLYPSFLLFDKAIRKL